jgi:hypothetical protein
MVAPKLYLGDLRIGGADQPAIISSSTASSIVNVTIGINSYSIYKFTGAGSITLSEGGVLDALVQGGGAPGNVVAGDGAGGAGGQIERTGIYIPSGTYSIRIGTGVGVYLGTSHAAGTSEFYGISAVGGAPASQYYDRTPGGGACGGSTNSIGAPSQGMYFQGRIGSSLRGGNASSSNNGAGGGVSGDGNGLGYDPGAEWGSPGILGCGGNAGYSMSANTGNGGNRGSNGNSGIILIRVKV